MAGSPDRTPDRIVVVGGGFAAGTAVTELRGNGFEGALTVFTEELHLPYERPPLSKDVLLGKGGPDDALVHPAAWYAAHDVDLRLGTRVSALDLAGRFVVADGDRTPYDRLLLATGARPRRFPPADEVGGPVTYLRTIDDAVALKERLTSGLRVGIVGGSWIGLEVAAAARENDAEVTLFETADEPLLPVLGREVGALFAALHRDHGVDLRTSTHVTEVDRAGDGLVVRPREGDPVHVDLLVIGVGVEPVVEPAGAAGLTIDNGIRVDAHLRTSDPHVWAAGDVANADHPGYGHPLRVEHWDVAAKHGAVAATNLAGGDAVADELPYFFTDQYDLGMEYVGHTSPGEFDRVVLRGDTAGLDYTAWWLAGRRVLAGMHVNDWDAIDDVRRIVGTDVDPDRLADEKVALGEV